MDPELTTITRKRISEILRSVFDFLWFEPNGLYAREILDHIANHGNLTEEERGSLPSIPGFQIYEIIIRIGSIPLEKAGWLVKTKRGRWYITEKGRNESKQFANAEDFFHQAIQYYEQWWEFEAAKLDRFDSLVRDQAEERAWEQIQDHFHSIRPSELNALVVELVKSLGYFVSWSASTINESTIVHIIATTDPFGINRNRLLIHINQAAQPTTLEGIKAFISMLKDNDHGVFISISGFTKSVMNDPSLNSSSNVNLIDLEKLVELWVKSQKKLTLEARELFPLKPVYFLALSDHLDNATRLYPPEPGSSILKLPEPHHGVEPPESENL